MRHTDQVKFTVEGLSKKPEVFWLPLPAGRSAKSFLANKAKEKSIAAEDVLPELKDDAMRPAAMLKASRLKADVTQKELAAALDIRQHHLSEMENGKRAISKAMAKELAEFFECDYRLFL